MTAFAAQFLRELLAVFLEASPYILFGFAIAACVHVLLPVHTVQRLLGRGRIRSVLWAAPPRDSAAACSCAVVPTALALKARCEQGRNRLVLGEHARDGRGSDRARPGV